MKHASITKYSKGHCQSSAEAACSEGENLCQISMQHRISTENIQNTHKTTHQENKLLNLKTEL